MKGLQTWAKLGIHAAGAKCSIPPFRARRQIAAWRITKRCTRGTISMSSGTPAA